MKMRMIFAAMNTTLFFALFFFIAVFFPYSENGFLIFSSNGKNLKKKKNIHTSSTTKL